MKRLMLLSLFVLTASMTAWALCAGTMNCPLHNGWVANYTGTQMIDGVLVGVYHCPFGPNGHNFVVKCP